MGLRFNLVGLVPATVAASLIVFMIWSGAPFVPFEVGPVIDQVLARVQKLDAAHGGFLAFLIASAAFLLQPLQLRLVRLLEGYWLGPKWAERLIDLLSSRHRNRHRSLSLQERAELGSRSPEEVRRIERARWELNHRYPLDPDRVLPTRLGNVLRAAEDRAGQRYGLQTVVVWPRLYPLLSGRLAQIIDDQRNQLDLAARFCVMFLAVATVYVAGLLLHARELAMHPGWLLMPVVIFGLAWLSYQGAIGAAMAYGTGIETAFDFHRFDMLASLHLPVQRDLKLEWPQNSNLSSFLAKYETVDGTVSDELNLRYRHGRGRAPRRTVQRS